MVKSYIVNCIIFRRRIFFIQKWRKEEVTEALQRNILKNMGHGLFGYFKWKLKKVEKIIILQKMIKTRSKMQLGML